jgi:hypothetical protein
MKTTLKLVAVTALMLAAVVACGKKDDKREQPSETSTTSAAVTAKASCNMVAELGTCNEYRGGTSFGLEKSLCEGFKGKFANQGCSADGQIGSCAMSDGEIKRYYGSKIAGDHALSLEEAKGDCEGELVKGTFTADANAAAAAAPEDAKPVTAAKPAAAGKAAAKAGVKAKK